MESEVVVWDGKRKAFPLIVATFGKEHPDGGTSIDTRLSQSPLSLYVHNMMTKYSSTARKHVLAT